MTTSPSPQRSASTVVAVLGLGAVLGWGIVYVPSAWLVESWPPLLAAGARVAIAGALLLLVLIALRRPFMPGCPWSVVLILAFTQSVLLYGASYIGIAYEGAGLTAVLQNTDPLFVALLAVLVLGEHLTRTQWAGLGVGLLGAIVVAWKGALWPPSVSLVSVVVLGGAIAWAVGTVAVARRIRGGAEPVAIAGWQMLIGGPVLILLSVIVEAGPTAMGGREIGLIVFIAVIGSALPFTFFYLALMRGGAAIVSSWFLLVPVVGVLTTWPLLGETPSAKEWVGLGMVCAGLWLVFRNASIGRVVGAGALSLDGVPDHADDDHELTEADRQWAAALNSALDDRRIEQREVDELDRLARDLGLSPSREARLAGFLMADHVAQALSDGVITPAERLDLENIGLLLGLSAQHVDDLIDMGGRESTGLAVSDIPACTSVRFRLPLLGTRSGVPLTRDDACLLAEGHGLRVVASALRRSDVIVVADVTELRGIDRLQCRRGARVMVERTFWMSINADMD